MPKHKYKKKSKSYEIKTRRKDKHPKEDSFEYLKNIKKIKNLK